MLGPFEVIRSKDVSVKIQLSQSIKIHNVFYSNLLCKAFTDLLTNQVNEPTPSVIINTEEK